MAETTKIAWCDATWNPWIGCTKVSAGCAFCYAEHTTRARVLRSKGQETWGKGAERSKTSTAYWKQPLRWNDWAMRMEHVKQLRPVGARNTGGVQRKRVFPSLCDWLDDEVPIEWLADFLNLIYETPNLSWLLLTKRPENFFARLELVYALAIPNVSSIKFRRGTFKWLDGWLNGGEAPENVWIGTSVENQAMADKRIPELLKIPAKIRFLSVEPLLGPIDLRISAFNGADSFSSLEGIAWVIVGGESGTKARPCKVEWIRDIVKQCAGASVPCFVKQLGQNIIVENDLGASVGIFTEHKKGGDPEEWPEDLRVRQMPR